MEVIVVFERQMEEIVEEGVAVAAAALAGDGGEV